ncbi:hypothetical protein WHR41_03594 [Cladosporium halotolerans]|uniref:Lytic polysaccharide monooxygenase n=1 Tax=Cladosporium halotolerans TaxID=1052096 RepID=A0AB34KSI0_9PEZI
MSKLLQILVAFLTGSTLAHMQLAYPPPFNASNNPYRTTPEDPYLQYPFDCCGPAARWQFPCRRYHDLLNTQDGLSTATWAAGSVQNWSMAGIGNHYGGSCQVGFSDDRGRTFRVATSYEGDCPHRNAGNGPDGQEFPFTVPRDLVPDVHIFAWTWYNREQEFNMNCAAVNITSPENRSVIEDENHSAAYTEENVAYSTTQAAAVSTSNVPNTVHDSNCSRETSTFSEEDDRLANHPHAKSLPRYVPFSSRPTMLLANAGNGCLAPLTDAELKYPEPGHEIVAGDGAYPLRFPVGNC